MFIAIHDVALRHVPINNWAIINLVLIIARTISYESQHLYLKNQKKRKPILHELLTYHQTLNLMTLVIYFLHLFSITSTFIDECSSIYLGFPFMHKESLLKTLFIKNIHLFN